MRHEVRGSCVGRPGTRHPLSYALAWRSRAASGATPSRGGSAGRARLAASCRRISVRSMRPAAESHTSTRHRGLYSQEGAASRRSRVQAADQDVNAASHAGGNRAWTLVFRPQLARSQSGTPQRARAGRYSAGIRGDAGCKRMRCPDRNLLRAMMGHCSIKHIRKRIDNEAGVNRITVMAGAGITAFLGKWVLMSACRGFAHASPAAGTGKPSARANRRDHQ